VCVSPEDQAARDQLSGRAHKLKGSAGMIGATDVMRLAGALEKALSQGRSAEAVEGLRRQLAAALTTLTEQTALYLKQQAECEASAGTKTVVHGNVSAAELGELCTLLESQNLLALDKFTLISPSLSETVGALRFNRLRGALENLDFSLGAQLLREAMSVGAPTTTPQSAARHL
jgi:chemotaxis protein histidine kinase CheA